MPNRPRIGCFIYNHSTFWSMIAHGVTTRAAEFGAHVDVMVARDVAGQDALLAELIRERVDAIIVGVIDPVHGARSAQAATQAGIPVIAVVAELNHSATSTVRVDDTGGAQLGAEHLAVLLNGRGTIAHLQGALEIRTAVNRSNGVRAVIAKYPAMQIVFEAQASDWSFEKGYDLMQQALSQHPELSGVITASDSIALGALAAIEEAGRLGDIPVIGFDGQPEALAAIHTGRLAASVDQPAYTIGVTAAEAVEQILSGQIVPAMITIPSKLISPDNLLDSAIQVSQILPGLFASFMEQSETQRQLQDQVILTQRSLIQELSAPILPLTHDIVALPLVGTIDSLRADRITELLLDTIIRTRARVVIVDISGVPIVDTGVANHLIKTATAARLLGTVMMLVGVSPELAQTIVQLGIDLSAIRTFSTMRDGLAAAQSGQIAI